MERPDIGRPFVGPAKQKRLVATTQNIEEASRIAEEYEMKGFQAEIKKKKQGGIALYEVWVSREHDVLTGKDHLM